MLLWSFTCSSVTSGFVVSGLDAVVSSNQSHHTLADVFQLRSNSSKKSLLVHVVTEQLFVTWQWWVFLDLSNLQCLVMRILPPHYVLPSFWWERHADSGPVMEMLPMAAFRPNSCRESLRVSTHQGAPLRICNPFLYFLECYSGWMADQKLESQCHLIKPGFHFHSIALRFYYIKSSIKRCSLLMFCF